MAYWKTTGVLDVLEKTSSALPFYKLLLRSDDSDEIIGHLVNHAKSKNYPLIENLDDLKEKFWMK